MAVVTKFFIVRNGVELDKVFEDKKEADAYDKMLDAAESLAAFIKKGELGIDLDEKAIDEISVHLAKNAPEVTNILKGIKPLKSSSPATAKSKRNADSEPAGEKKSAGKKSEAGQKEI